MPLWRLTRLPRSTDLVWDEVWDRETDPASSSAWRNSADILNVLIDPTVSEQALSHQALILVKCASKRESSGVVPSN